MKHERAQHRASVVAFFKYATLDEVRELDKARMRIVAARISAAKDAPTCCNWHRSGGLVSVPCRDTVSDDGGWNDGAAAQLAAMGRKGKVNK